MRKTIAYVALGSNLNHPEKQVEIAVEFIRGIPSTNVTAESSVYETLPLGPSDQPNYINQVIAVETELSAHDLLHALQAIENKMGRVRTVRWGARIIDCDIILFGDESIQTDELTIPHPEYKNRDFVLYPLAEIRPDLVLPLGRGIQYENSDLPRHIRSHHKRAR